MSKYLDAHGVDILSVKCPKCGREPSLHCVSSPGGHLGNFPHVARFDLARAERQAEDTARLLVRLES